MRPAIRILLLMLICSHALSLQPISGSHAECSPPSPAHTHKVLLSQLGRGLVESVALWHRHGLVHRDLSASNVGLADDGSVLIWDFATMASLPARRGEPGRWTGTWMYMAISVQQGAASTLSSELESIFYILTGLSSRDGMMHWHKSWPGSSDAKIAAMMDALTFHAEGELQFCLPFLTCTRLCQLNLPHSGQDKTSKKAALAKESHSSERNTDG